MRSFLFLFCILATLPLAAQHRATDLRCEHLHNPLGIDAAQPRFSWKTTTSRRNWLQGACQIQVAQDTAFAAQNLVWDTKKRRSDASILIEYEGIPLLSRQRYHWRVRTWDQAGDSSAWSATAHFEMALLNESDWQAWWIEPDPEDEPPRYIPAALLRKQFDVQKKVVRARAYATAHGIYTLHLNGQPVGDQVLTPGWTSYHKRLQYQCYDITALLREGTNAVGAMLGEGWYRSGLGWEKNWAFYGKKTGFLCQIHVEYADGSSQIILTDATWKCTRNGPIGKNEIYYGEDYDARKALKGWAEPGFDERTWQAVKLAQHPKNLLLAQQGVPIRRIQEIRPVAVFRTPKGEWVADMGQNMVGWVRLRITASRGKVITLSHAEVLDKAGNFYTENLRAAKQQIRYTAAGTGVETYEPQFTFMGFRYVRVEGLDGPLLPEHVTGLVIHSDMPETGSFECSHPLVNQLQHNIQWGQKGNFLDIPTDCPQRDERLGWTGDAQAFAATAAYNMDVAAFFQKWLQDLRAAQRGSGAVPFVVPDVLNKISLEKIPLSAGWSDAAVIIPWAMYQQYADRRLLEAQYPSMKAYVEYVRRQSGEGLVWKGGSVFGDWLFYHPPTGKVNDHAAPDAYTNHDLVATAFFAHSADLLAQTAAVLGRQDDARQYRQLFEDVRKVFVREFCTPSGRITSESQTSYLLALRFDLLPPELRGAALGHLVADIRGKRNHLSTGFLGTPHICHVLTAHDSTQLAYELLFQETYPSWLYPVKMGATTIWERWDGQKTDSTFQDASMNSFNHYAYGAIGDWMYQVVAGIRAAAPAYKEILIAPEPSDKLTYARATHESPYGLIASAWERRQGGSLQLSVQIPSNTQAVVRLPVKDAARVLENGKSLRDTGFGHGVDKNGFVTVQIGSGAYIFTCF